MPRNTGTTRGFEALVAGIAAEFIDKLRTRQGERCWIAERGGEILGSVFSGTFVEERGKAAACSSSNRARRAGSGVGRRLVDECIAFARRGRLPQNGVGGLKASLLAARAIYARAPASCASMPSRIAASVAILVAETWALPLFRVACKRLAVLGRAIRLAGRINGISTRRGATAPDEL